MLKKLSADFASKAEKAARLKKVELNSTNAFLRTYSKTGTETGKQMLYDRAMKNFTAWNDADLARHKAEYRMNAFAPGHGSDWVKFRRHLDKIKYEWNKKH